MSNTVPSRSVCICLECGESFYSRTKFTTPGVSGYFCSSMCGGSYATFIFARETARRLAAARQAVR